MTTKQPTTKEPYQLSQSEQRYLARFYKMQSAAQSQQRPQVLMVVFDGRTVSFFSGTSSGIDRGDK